MGRNSEERAPPEDGKAGRPPASDRDTDPEEEGRLDTPEDIQGQKPEA